MSTYASKTSVAVERSRAEIEKTLVRYGATAFVVGWEGDRCAIQFEASDRRVRMTVTLPDRNDPAIQKTPTGQTRSASSQQKEWEQACRQKWRAMALIVKAKLEAIECGISSFDDEFMAHIMLPDGSTVAENVQASIDHAYDTGLMPSTMLALGDGT